MNFDRKEISRIVIVGAGPAGSSLAIRLANANFKVVLIERERFPRHKLCGEFISPECLEYFRELEVLDEMFAVEGERILQTVFYEPGGKNVAVESNWFSGSYGSALSLSRAEMDFRLLKKAKAVGVEVLEESNVVGLITRSDQVCGVKVRLINGSSLEIAGDLTVDATGRAAVLTKLVQRQAKDLRAQRSAKKPKSKYVGFKAHVRNVEMQRGSCEIYFFRGGYGGLSFIENGFANHCFLIKTEVVKEFNGNADKIVENVVLTNKRASVTLRNAVIERDWLAVAVDEFGKKNICPARGLVSVGDASAFIDPFTGSGMLMALEGAEILSNLLTEKRISLAEIEKEYRLAHKKRFQRRLLICSVLRQAAFSPSAAKMFIAILGASKSSRELLARATRRFQPNG